MKGPELALSGSTFIGAHDAPEFFAQALHEKGGNSLLDIGLRGVMGPKLPPFFTLGLAIVVGKVHDGLKQRPKYFRADNAPIFLGAGKQGATRTLVKIIGGERA